MTFIPICREFSHRTHVIINDLNDRYAAQITIHSTPETGLQIRLEELGSTPLTREIVAFIGQHLQAIFEDSSDTLTIDWSPGQQFTEDFIALWPEKTNLKRLH